MPDKLTKRRDLLRALGAYGVMVDLAGGKGSHCKLVRVIGGQRVSTILPDREEYPPSVVRQARKKFKLTADDGVSDHEFYRH